MGARKIEDQGGGIQVISTYVFWIHREEIEEQFDWSGQRELPGLSSCVQSMHIRVASCRAMVRNGGLPDWLLQKTATRENNPTEIRYAFLSNIGEQGKERPMGQMNAITG